jgi:ABC-type polysaccharide/polyol phosphate export permease
LRVHRVGPLAALREIGAELEGSGHLLRQFVLRDLRVRYKQAVLGAAWAVFMPVLVVLSGVLVRYAMAQMGSIPFDGRTIAALALKGLGWGFFSGAIGMATPCLITNGNLVAKVYFPREVLPVATILAQGVDSMVGATLLALLAPLLGISFSAGLLWLPALALLLLGFTMALGLVLSAANVFFRDVKYIVQVLLTFGIFFTPVFYEPEMLGPTGAGLLMLNPLAPLLEGMRLAVVEGHDLLRPLEVATPRGVVLAWTPWWLAYSAVWAVGGLLAAALAFHRVEPDLSEFV